MLRMFPTTFPALLCLLIFGCETNLKPAKTEQEVIIVRIPPASDPRASAGENHCRFSLWRYEGEDGKDVAAACKDAALPNDGVPLLVRLDANGDLSLNNEPNGSLADLKPLTARLVEIFEQRRINHVFEPESSKVEKGVGIRIPVSAKYSEAISVIPAAKESNVEPIILYLDGYLPEQMYIELKNGKAR